MYRAVLAALVVSASACGGPRVWYRDGIGAEATTLDLEGCTLWASDRVAAEEGVRLPASDRDPGTGLDEYFDEERALRDEYVARCMKRAGYELVARDSVEGRR